MILLDEPLAGLDAHEAERLAGALSRTVEEEKVSLLLVEHDVGMVLSLSSHIYVLDFGVADRPGCARARPHRSGGPGRLPRRRGSVAEGRTSTHEGADER